MLKIDLKKKLKTFYSPSRKHPEIVEVPEMLFLKTDGINALPDSPDFQTAIQALFNVSYKTKFLLKKEKEQDYVVMPLEGLWWADDMDDFINGNKEQWKWTLMIMQPDFVTQEVIDEAINISRKKNNLEAFNHLRLERYDEGPSAQILHIGPYSEEYGNIMKLHDLIEENGGQFDGQVQKHHEIYLSDFRRVAPEKLKTVLRQPFVR